MKTRLFKLMTLIIIVGLALPFAAFTGTVRAATPINFTILHTNDFHGQLVYDPAISTSNPGAARVANKIESIRTTVGAANMLLLDAGDMMQGSLLSNIQKGLPTVDYYKTIGYDGVTFGNHEFDWGQVTLAKRALQAADATDPAKKAFPMLAANIVQKVGGSCAGWDKPVLSDGGSPANTYTVEPYKIYTVGTDPNTVKVGVIGVSSIETPYITLASATEGLCFKDPADSILHYYDQMKTDGANVIVVLSHNGYTDGGYGYGFTVYGDQTLATKLTTAGKPANLIIGGHSHTDLSSSAPTGKLVGTTLVVQAHYNGRQVGQADFTYDPGTGAVTIAWKTNKVTNTEPLNATINTLITGYVNDPAYQALINQEIGYSQVNLIRNYDNGNNYMNAFIDDALLNAFNTDAEPANDVDIFFNNAGGLRADVCTPAETVPCTTTSGLLTDPFKLTYGAMFSILPFGNEAVVGEMTGAQILDILHQSASLFKGSIQNAGIRFKFYRYAKPDPSITPPPALKTTWAWGAYDIEVKNRTTSLWEPLDPSKTYKVGTNNFLAPAGQDGYNAFKYFKNPTYWGDMLNIVNAYVTATYTLAAPYKGPNGDGTLDNRVIRDGTDDGGTIIPLTILHHNDSHGNLVKGTYVGYTQLATIIKQERAYNPTRTLLLSAGDNIQGDAMMYYFKSAGLGYASDGTPLPSAMSINPLLKAFNSMGYAAWTLGNHEFNFGKEIFATLSDANFPLLQANVSDTGEYGLSYVPVLPFTKKTVGAESIKVSILGIGNHRVPNYELPSNIPGLSFSDPIATAAEYVPELRATSDVVIALTHIGFTTNPSSVEVDNNVDTYLAGQVSGIDAIIGSHSHTDPSKGFGDYKYLPALLSNPNKQPVLVTQAYRYNNYLGEVILGLRAKRSPATLGGPNYEVVSQTGRYFSITLSTPEDAELKTMLQPYVDLQNAYNNTVLGTTLTPIDALPAFTTETNGANLQADAAVWKLRKEGKTVDFHLSGAMTNKKIADTATPSTPYTLKVSDMFTAMPYENSLLVLQMNGPQLKAVLERAYRNYFYYKYVPGYGGYSYYTTCMIDTNAGNVINYRDTYPEYPNGNNVVSLVIGGTPIDFTDADTYYNVSTVNYLAAGSCNFNNGGTTLWPLSQIVADTQYYVRDAVIEYTKAQTDPLNPQIEGRLVFKTFGYSYRFPMIAR